MELDETAGDARQGGWIRRSHYAVTNQNREMAKQRPRPAGSRPACRNRLDPCYAGPTMRCAETDRRSFLAAAVAATVAGRAAAAPAPGPARLPVRGPACAEVRLAVVGLRSRGWEHVNAFARVPGCRVVALCDVDRDVLAQRADECRKGDERRPPFEVKTYGDPRALFAADDIDAIAIATPNHTHAMLGVFAMQAGKHVYVEKPVSHVVDEGQRLVDVAAATKKVCASGTQARSHKAVREAMAFVHGGGLGTVLCVRGLCYKPRRPIGVVAGPQFAPSSVDYDRWLGPVEYRPLRRKNLHYDWHWDLHTGNGDLGNQGIHQMDLARWALSWCGLPDMALSLGGRFGEADDGDSPNTQVVWLDCGGTPLLFEVRGLPKDAAEQRGKWQMDRFQGVDIGVVVHGERGTVRFTADYGRAAHFNHAGKVVQEWTGGGDHFANFVQACAANEPALLTAPVLEGHLSSAFCHYGIVSHQCGVRGDADAAAQAADRVPELAAAYARMAAHLQANGVDLATTPLTIGRLLTIAKPDGGIVDDPAASERCRRVARPPYTF
ncbi:MAG: Gfo/Idh/MocA family oxidoreductase [Planctomycetes bacterium]|nr:Gfo/Idh/MocA family oxidoreductase [Planctomycetota bacterium]